MPSITEIRKISLRNLHRSATQDWGKRTSASSTARKKFERSSSMPAMRTNGFQKKNSKSGQTDLENDDFESHVHASLASEDVEDDILSEVNDNYQSITFGFQTKAAYVQHSKMTDIMDVLYNGRTRSFYLLDSRGISSWHPNSDDQFKREFSFPKYKIKLLRSLIYCKKYNVYFTVCSDFTLKVFNKDFHETCKAENKSMRSILHIIFNPVTDELISSGVAGTTVWKYTLMETNLFDTIKPMANYELKLHAEYPEIGGTWCTKIELISSTQHLFFCAPTDLYAYDARDMRKLFTIHNAHNSALSCVGFSSVNRILITGSVDTEVKVWGATGGHICTWRGHSRPISSVIFHPDIAGLVFTSSLDGMIKVWSLHTMDLFYSLNVFSEGIFWMNLTDDGLIWCCNARKMTVFKFNPVVTFWGHTRCRINHLEVLDHPDKTTRIMALGEDGSVRLFSQSRSDASALCTVLPPPIVSLLDNVRDVTHSRFNHLFFVLINLGKIWVYTAKTDPACRVAEWDVPMILKEGVSTSDSLESVSHKPLPTSTLSGTVLRNFEEMKGSHRCVQILSGRTTSSACCCVLAVFSENGFQYHTPVGLCSAKSRNLLMFGLEDGRIVFADQKQRGLLYCELQANKEAIVSLKHKRKQNWLITQCNNTNKITFQIWKLPEIALLHTIHTDVTTTCYAVLDDALVTGHSTGHINICPIENDDGSNDESDNPERQPEHRSEIINVKSCKKQGVFCSCSTDGVIRLWNLEKVLLCDIHLGEDLSCCNFLNSHGDLLVGWKRHLFVIDHKTLSLQSLLNKEELSETCEKESAIYEDPSVRYESTFAKKLKKPSVITMKNYLVPYGFVATESDAALDLRLNLVERAESEQTESSEVTLCANTDTYLSPAMSMESFGIIDALFPHKSSVNKIQNKADMMLPKFGISPGSTPAESIASVSEHSIFIEEDEEQEYPNVFEAAKDGFLHPQSKDETVDLQEKLSVGVVVAKAIKKMSGKKKPLKEEQLTGTEIKSRFAGTTLDSRNLMKKGMNVVFAVESLQKDKRPAASHSEKPSMKQFTKKTRRPSTANSRRKSLVPAEIPLQPLQVKDDGSAGDSDSVSESHELDKKDLEVKLGELGKKMTPHSKVEEYSSNLPQLGKFTSSQHRKKHSAYYGGSAKPNLHLSNKLKRKAKSATLARRRSFFGKHDTQLKVTSSTDKGSKSSKNSAAAWLSQISKDQSRNIATAEDTKTSDDLLHVKPSETPESMKQNGLMGDADEERKVNFVDEKQKKEIQSDEHPALSIEHLARGTDQEERKLHDEEEYKYKGFLHLNKNKDGDESVDEDELTIPNLLEFDFHAIYKKDGLQFDEKWQDRMLERYLLLKLQKEQRHEAAMNKRIYLEQERHFRLIASQPDLIQKYHEPWYEDPNLLANCILNSRLMKGDVSSSPDILFHENRPDSQLSRRPTSVASNYNNGYEHFADGEEKTFRFSIRSKSCDIDERASMLLRRSRHSGRQLPPAPSTSNTSIRSKSSNSSQQKFVADRPRSSTSIPGKTRYILIKPEHEKKLEKTVSPTKLEETLLRKRFPSQHLCVMRSLGRLDEMHIENNSTREEVQPHQDRPYSRTSASSELRKIHTAPSNGFNGLSNNAHKSETDTYLMDIKKFSREINHSQSPHRHSWKSVTSDSCINPFDIVKRKSSHGSSLKFAAKSVHA